MIKANKIMIKIFLFSILLFPMNVYSDVNDYQDSGYVKNNFSIKEQEYLKKYVLQSSAFLMRAVGNSKYSSSILSDQNNHFILEQSINFYRKFDVKHLPDIVQKYLFQCFLINQMILNESERSYFKKVILLNKKKVIENQFHNEMKKYGYNWKTILTHFMGEKAEDVMRKAVADNFEKFTNNRTGIIDSNDKRTMEAVIKNAYIEFANYLDEKSQKK